ncbi:type II secretion system protein GspM [Pantoea sp.]|uniref:type II secretion system protein GspM n=2 Tax=Pantoea sp. TaxID=69393 RepID=UPI00289D9AE7|nr:type II secretion system protein GspM [Pantoea sp.]
MELSMLLSCAAGRLNAFYHKMTEIQSSRLKCFLLAGIAILSAGLLVMLNNRIEEKLAQVRHNEKTIQAMLTLAEQHALTVKTLQVSDPLRAMDESARKAGIHFNIITRDKQQVRLSLSEITLPDFIAWTEQLNKATGIQLSQAVLSQGRKQGHIQAEALLSWGSAP